MQSSSKPSDDKTILKNRNFKKRRLLFKNAFKNTLAAKAQLAGLIILMFLSALVITTVSITNSRIVNNINYLKQKSNIHDFVADFSNTSILSSTPNNTLQNHNYHSNPYLQPQLQESNLNISVVGTNDTPIIIDSNGADSVPLDSDTTKNAIIQSLSIANADTNLVTELNNYNITLTGPKDISTSAQSVTMQLVNKTNPSDKSTYSLKVATAGKETPELVLSEISKLSYSVPFNTNPDPLTLGFAQNMRQALIVDIMQKFALENWLNVLSFSDASGQTLKPGKEATIVAKASIGSSSDAKNLKVTLSGASGKNDSQIKQDVLNLASTNFNNDLTNNTHYFQYNRVESRLTYLDGSTKKIKVIGYNPRQTIDKLITTEGQPLENYEQNQAFNPTGGNPVSNVIRAIAHTKVIVPTNLTLDTTDKTVQASITNALEVKFNNLISYLDANKVQLSYKGTLKTGGLASIDVQVTDNGESGTTNIEVSTTDPLGIVFNRQFANNNNVKIGDIVRLQSDYYGDQMLVRNSNPALKKAIAQFQNEHRSNNISFSTWLNGSAYANFNWFQVQGFGISADMISPIIDANTAIPNKKNEGVVYINNYNLGLTFNARAHEWLYDGTHDKVNVESNEADEVYFVGKFNSNVHWPNAPNQAAIINDINKHLRSGVYLTFSNIKFKYVFSNSNINSNNFLFLRGDNHYKFNNRTALINQVINAYQDFGLLLLAFILVITGIAMVIVTKKRLDKSRRQVGILKALGYKNWSLLLPYLIYPILISLLGGTIGFIGGVGLQFIPVMIFGEYFNANFGSFTFDWISWLFSIIISFVVLASITLIVVWIMLMNKPIALIKADELLNNNMSGIGKSLKNLAVKTSFKNRLKVAMFTSSIGKMSAVFVTMIAGSMIMVLALLGPNIIKDNIKYNYLGLNYKTSVFYNSPSWNVPSSFYNVYNYTQSPWDPSLDSKQFMPDLQTIFNGFDDGNINEQYYTTNPDIVNKDIQAQYLQNLSWRSFNFKSLQLAVSHAVAQTKNSIPLAQATIQFTWPDYANLVNPQVMQLIFPNASSGTPQYSLWNTTEETPSIINQQYNLLRSFYIKYSNTVYPTVNPFLLKDKSKFSSNKLYFGDNAAGPNDFNFIFTDPSSKTTEPEFHYLYTQKPTNPSDASKDVHPFTILNHHLGTAEHTAILTNTIDAKGAFNKANLVQDMVNWFNTEFLWRPTVAVVQAAFSRSPYFVRENMLSAWNKGQNFNVGFNIEPVNPLEDYLGTAVTIQNSKNNFRLLGLSNPNLKDNSFSQHSNDFVKLVNNHGSSINNLLYQNNPSSNRYPIIINQSAAKKLQIGVGDNVTWNALVHVLKGKINNSSDDALPTLKNISSSSWEYGTANENHIINDTDQGYLGQSLNMNGVEYGTNKIKPYAASPIPGAITLSPMTQSVHKGYVNSVLDKQPVNFQVVGIHNSYGQPIGFISQKNANAIEHYDLSEHWLFNIFKLIWTEDNYKNIDSNYANQDLATFLQQIHNPNTTYDSVSANPTDPKNAIVLKIFHNSFPVYNYKLSHNSSLVDLNSAASISNTSGDFSVFALNGYNDPTTGDTYSRNGISTVNSLLPLDYSKEILQQLSAIIDIILIFFAVIALATSIIIIVLATNLIITENQKYICSLKLFGYNDQEITRIVTGMYIPLIVGAFIIGLPSGWFITKAIIAYLAVHTSWVLPLTFTWWLPIGIGLIIFGIYTLTYLCGWYNLKKISPLDVIKKD